MKRMNIVITVLLAASAVCVTEGADELAQAFAQPPASARPWVYWFASNGNLTKEGITADLEAMARVGIGGVLYMEVDQCAPKGRADFAGPLWRELFSHACKEAQRLGMQINMNNDASWSGSGGPWITPELSMQKVVWTETPVEGGRPFDGALDRPQELRGFYRDIAVLAMPAPDDDKFRLKDIAGKAAYNSGYWIPAPATWPAAPQDAVIPREKIVDVSAKMDASGKFTWDPPAGKWLVIRFGCTTTGSKNDIAPESGRGLECDKLSKEALAVHYNALLAKLVADNKPLAGQDKVLVSTHIDSWEVGSQNWTPKMREEFKNRRGYDLIPFLPAFAGRIIDSTEVTERFLWDLRQTVSDLIVENYAGELRRLANRDGLRLSIEAYFDALVDEMTYGGQADEPMGEFWSWERFGMANTVTEMASSAHTYGKNILGAEAFTANDAEKWQGHPANIKGLGDWAFCEGVNRFVFHRYAAQPWTNNLVPGMCMGPWGLHYERTQTWWEQSKPWHDYLARCQFMLRQGLFVADVAYLQPEGARGFIAPQGAEIAPHIRSGYNFDGCSPDVVLTRMAVKDGRIVLPDGMSYRVLVVPPLETITPRLLRKIRELADTGATILADPKPPQSSPSLADMGARDAELKAQAAALWTRIVTNKTAAQLLGERGVQPDFSATPKNLRYIHRTTGDAEIYFVANPDPRTIATMAAFRVVGKQPEFWWPDTGRTAPALAYEEKDGVTHVPVRLEPNGSVFVVFRSTAKAAERIVSVTRDGQELLSATGQDPHTSTLLAGSADENPALDITRGEIWQSGEYVFKTASGKNRQVRVSLPAAQELVESWEVAFDPKRGGPGNVTFGKLEDWSKRTEDGIKYYSGTAVYRTTFQAKKDRTYLDLGNVAVMAEVTLNGRSLGVLWKPPYRVDVTKALKNGENKLEVNVVNLWINRQIGDEQLPEDGEYHDYGWLKSWPQWLQEGKPRPSGRFTFSSWRLWKKSDPLVESGLIGPVTLQSVEHVAVP